MHINKIKKRWNLCGKVQAPCDYLPISREWTNFSITYCTKLKFKGEILYGQVWHLVSPHQIKSDQIFLIILNFKCKIIFSLFFAKKCWGLILAFSISAPLPTSMGRQFTKNKNNFSYIFQLRTKFKFSDQYLVKSLFFGSWPNWNLPKKISMDLNTMVEMPLLVPEIQMRTDVLSSSNQ